MPVMENHTIKIPGKFEEVSVRCPKCQSSDVLIAMDDVYYTVDSCNNCNYGGGRV